MRLRNTMATRGPLQSRLRQSRPPRHWKRQKKNRNPERLLVAQEKAVDETTVRSTKNGNRARHRRPINFVRSATSCARSQTRHLWIRSVSKRLRISLGGRFNASGNQKPTGESTKARRSVRSSHGTLIHNSCRIPRQHPYLSNRGRHTSRSRSALERKGILGETGISGWCSLRGQKTALSWRSSRPGFWPQECLVHQRYAS